MPLECSCPPCWSPAGLGTRACVEAHMHPQRTSSVLHHEVYTHLDMYTLLLRPHTPTLDRHSPTHTVALASLHFGHPQQQQQQQQRQQQRSVCRLPCCLHDCVRVLAREQHVQALGHGGTHTPGLGLVWLGQVRQQLAGGHTRAVLGGGGGARYINSSSRVARDVTAGAMRHKTVCVRELDCV
jgi:hypothetical protein